MCNPQVIGFHLAVVHTALVAAIVLVGFAIAANASFFGAGASPGLIAGATVALAGAAGASLFAVQNLNRYVSCMSTNFPRTRVSCTSELTKARKAIIALDVAIGTAGVASVAVAFGAAVPWVAIPGMIALSVAIAAAVALAVAASVLVVNLVKCKEDARTRPPTPSFDVVLFTCPMNRTVCADGDMQIASQINMDRFKTTPSFAIAVEDQQRFPTLSIKAQVMDNFQHASNNLTIRQPGAHSFSQFPKHWIVRGDWGVLSNELRLAQPPNNVWTVFLEVTVFGNPPLKRQIKLVISN